MTEARTYCAPADRLQVDEERSIATAMRTTLWFLAIVLLLAWAGVADASLPPVAAEAAAAARAG